MLPADPSLECQQWECRECGAEVARQTVISTVGQLEAEMMDTMDTETEKYRAIIKKYSDRLYPNHYQVDGKIVFGIG